MANVVGKTEWQVTLTTEEFRLVLKALGGRLKDEEVASARALGDRLSHMRAQFTKSQGESNNKLLENLDA
jgi:hypothetical protein